MANYTAADIKDLREKTGAGMLDVKKALDEADGDAEKALEIIRVKGLKGVAKREGRAASEGLVAIDVTAGNGGEVATLIELNCETDFVAKNDKFIALADQVLAAAAAAGAKDAEQALAADASGQSVQDLITAVAAELGEKLVLRRVAQVSGPQVATYLHRTAKDLPPAIGVAVAINAGAVETGREIAQHIAALSPNYLSREDVPADTVENERRIAEETSRNEGKPEAALPKIVEGRLNGFFKENVLLDQGFARDPKQSVQKVLEAAGAEISQFVRFRVGS